MSITALATPNLRAHSLNPLWFRFSESDGDVVKFVVKIYFETSFGSDHYALGAQFVQFPDTADDIKFDAGEIARGRVKPAQLGVYGASPGLQTICVQRYKYDVSSKDETGAEISFYEQTTPQYIYYGGIRWEQWLDAHFFTDWLPTQLNFLTWQPNNQRVDLDQHVYLTWLPLETGLTYLLNFKIYYRNGSPAFHEPVNYTASDLRPYTFIASMKAHAATITDYNDTDIVKYEVWLSSLDVAVSEVRTFYIDHNVYRSKKKFVWANTIGGVDSMLCTGNYAHEYEYGGDEAIIYVPPDYDVVDGQMLTYDYDEQGEPTASTGWKTKAEIDHMRDALLSLHLMEDTGTQFIPVTIDRGSIRIFESEQKMFALQFRYKHLFKNRVYTGGGYDNTVRA